MRKPKRRPSSIARTSVLLQALEPRQMLATPSGLQPGSLPGFDKGERIALIDRFDNLSNRSSLKAKIGSGGTSQLRDFDDALLAYMRGRTNVRWYFDDDQAAANGTYIKNNLSFSKPIDQANLMVDSRLFPNRSNSETYSHKLSGDVNFRAPDGDLGNSFSLVVNRFEYWGNLSDSAWLGNDRAKYTDEVTYQLARWSGQFGSNIDVPSNWNSNGKTGWGLVTSIRAEAWTNAYFKLLSADNASWGGADDTLMLYQLVRHGDFLFKAANSAKVDASVDSNKTISLAKSLFLLGKMFPELDTAAAWEAKGRSLLVQSMNAQVYADGSHHEQSPGYTQGVAEDLLDAYQLDKLNGDSNLWSAGTRATMGKIIESYRQFLTPDGRRPGTGDTIRSFSVSLFLKGGIILDTIRPTSTTLSAYANVSAASLSLADASTIDVGDTLTPDGKTELLRVTGKSGNTVSVERGFGGTNAQVLQSGTTIHVLGDQPFAKPSTGDVWLLGRDAVHPFRRAPATPAGALGKRGKTYAMPDSGNYIIRSDDSNSATQITFDSGPRGGLHGHYDLLNFELWSGSRPLIVDPGPYKYDGGSDRAYVVSTKAHNTLNVDGQNVGSIEGEDQPAIITSTNFQSGFAQVTGTHFAYSRLAGQPVITRSVWYNYGDTMLVVDFAEGAAQHAYQQSFNVPGTAEANVTGASGGSEFKTRYADGGDNVRVKAVNGGALVKGPKTFVTGDDSGDYKDDAYRYTVTKNDDFAVFVTLVNVYTGQTVPDVDAQLLTSDPKPGKPIQVRLLRDGATERTLTFQQAALTRPGSNLNLNAQVNDVKVDRNGNLHAVYQDQADGFLKWTVRDKKTSQWSVVQTVDNSAKYVAAQIDLEFDNDGRPAVAYYDQPHGDLKYAIMGTDSDSWRTQTVDSAGTVGQNPSLTFSRNGNRAMISYYDKTKGDLKVATQGGVSDFSRTTIESKGDVGRYSQIALDPNRTDLNARYVVAYEDRTNRQYKYRYENGGVKTESIKGKDITETGGYLSLAFEDTKSGGTGTPESTRYQPRLSFYERAPDASLWFAKRDKSTGSWSTQRVDGAGGSKTMGAYNQLSYASGKAEIFYLDEKAKQLRHAVIASGSTWRFSNVAAGGRELRVARSNSTWWVSNFDPADGKLTIETA